VPEEFNFVEERAEIFSQDSLRKTQRDNSPLKIKDIDKALGPTLTIRASQKNLIVKGMSNRNVIKAQEGKKKHKKKLKLKINNILADIDKSIYEINKNSDNKVVLK